MSKPANIDPGPRCVGGCLLNLDRKILSKDDEEVQISPLGCRLIAALADADGALVERSTLIATLWDGNHLVGEAALNRLVSEVRRAAATLPGQPELIHTIPRKGYRIAAAPAPMGRPPWPLSRWLGLALILILSAVLLNWVLDTAIGFVWALRHL